MAKLRLEEYLEENDISKNEFARRLGVNSPVVRRFIKPDYDPKLSTLTKWAAVLNCSVSKLLDEPKSSKSKKNS
jgi:transcriptional regulator with XRE-family HTH domain